MGEKERATITAAPTVDDAKVHNNSESTKDSQDNLQQGVDNLIKECNGLKSSSEQPKPDEHGFFCASDLLAMPPTKMPTLYDPIIPQASICVLGGESEAGKSMLLRNLAICVATGREFLGFPFGGRYKSAIYAASEDEINATNFFLHLHNRFYQDGKDDWRGLHFIYELDDIIGRLDARLNLNPADLVIIDSLGDFFNGKDMNNSAQVRLFMRPFKELIKKYGCTIIFLHHINKWMENNAPSKNALSGSQSLEAIARACFMLVNDRNDPNLRHFCIVKHNYLGNAYKSESIELRLDSDSFTFMPTGNRVPLDQLAESSPPNQKKKSVKDYGTDDDFAKFFESVIGDGGISKTDLVLAIREHFRCRQTNAYEIINAYAYKGWITNTSKRKDKVNYEYSKPF